MASYGATQDCAQFGLYLFAALRHLSADGYGVTRGGYSPQEDAAHALLATTARRHGLEVSEDAARNTWVELPGTDTNAKPVVIGSHLDSVKCGGNFDGAAGVVAGLATLLRIRAAHSLPRTVRLVAFRAEEAAWFGTCYIGSRALVGTLGPEMLDIVSPDLNITLRQALEKAGADVRAMEAGEPLIDPRSIHQYLELHIEQGPVLIDRGCAVGAVTGIRGNHRYQAITWLGDGGHSGAVTRRLRRDPVLGVARWLTELERMWIEEEEAGADLVITSGMVATDANHHAVTRIADSLRLSLDIRSVDDATLQRVSGAAESLAKEIAQTRGLRVHFGDRIDTPPANIDPATVTMIHEMATSKGYPAIKLASGAGHDAAALGAAGVPIGMIFVRNANGSHNPLEALDIDDFCAGVDVLTAVTERVAR